MPSNYLHSYHKLTEVLIEGRTIPYADLVDNRRHSQHPDRCRTPYIHPHRHHAQSFRRRRHANNPVLMFRHTGERSPAEPTRAYHHAFLRVLRTIRWVAILAWNICAGKSGRQASAVPNFLSRSICVESVRSPAKISTPLPCAGQKFSDVGRPGTGVVEHHEEGHALTNVNTTSKLLAVACTKATTERRRPCFSFIAILRKSVNGTMSITPQTAFVESPFITTPSWRRVHLSAPSQPSTYLARIISSCPHEYTECGSKPLPAEGLGFLGSTAANNVRASVVIRSYSVIFFQKYISLENVDDQHK